MRCKWLYTLLRKLHHSGGCRFGELMAWHIIALQTSRKKAVYSLHTKRVQALQTSRKKAAYSKLAVLPEIYS